MRCSDPLQPVVYANGDDFEREVAAWLAAKHWKVEGKGVRSRTARDSIGLGVDCADSLLWEGVTGHAQRLIPLFTFTTTNPQQNPLVLLTKSANTHYLGQIDQKDLHRHDGKIPNVIVTMSVNPESIADLWEGKYPDTLERITPPIAKRLEALKVAQDMGFEVRVRVDPILTPDGWQQQYAEFFTDIAHGFGLRPSMITLGTFRMKTPQLDTFRAKWGLPAMEWTPETSSSREGTHLHVIDRGRVYTGVRETAIEAFKGTGHTPWISVCKETHAVRKANELCNAHCNCLADLTVTRNDGDEK